MPTFWSLRGSNVLALASSCHKPPNNLQATVQYLPIQCIVSWNALHCSKKPASRQRVWSCSSPDLQRQKTNHCQCRFLHNYAVLLLPSTFIHPTHTNMSARCLTPACLIPETLRNGTAVSPGFTEAAFQALKA